MDRPSLMKLLSKLFWGAFQLSVVALFLWVDWTEGRKGRPQNPVMALFVGAGLALSLTVAYALAADTFRNKLIPLIFRQTKKRQPRDESRSLTPIGGRQPGELIGGAGISQKPREFGNVSAKTPPLPRI